MEELVGTEPQAVLDPQRNARETDVQQPVEVPVDLALAPERALHELVQEAAIARIEAELLGEVVDHALRERAFGVHLEQRLQGEVAHVRTAARRGGRGRLPEVRGAIARRRTDADGRRSGLVHGLPCRGVETRRPCETFARRFALAAPPAAVVP